MLVGYARVSTQEQTLSMQMDALNASGCEQIFTDKISGAKEERPGLQECLASLQKGDCLVVWRIDRLGRSLRHLVATIEDLKARGIQFKSLQDGAIDTTTASGNLVFHIFAAMAEFERSLIQERVNAGLEAARARGRTGGRPRLSVHNPKIKLAKRLFQDKSLSLTEICEMLDGISKTTLFRWAKMKE